MRKRERGQDPIELKKLSNLMETEPRAKKQKVDARIEKACSDAFRVWDMAVEKFGPTAAPHLTKSVMMKAGMDGVTDALNAIHEDLNNLQQNLSVTSDNIGNVADATKTIAYALAPTDARGYFVGENTIAANLFESLQSIASEVKLASEKFHTMHESKKSVGK